MIDKKIVKEYQCAGCILDCIGEPEKDDIGIGCKKHASGIFNLHFGKFLLGMPKGFNRLGMCEKMKLFIFKNKEQQKIQWNYDKFNILVWKYLKEEVCFIRGLMPRINEPFLHVIANISRDEFNQIECLEITNEDLEEMD